MKQHWQRIAEACVDAMAQAAPKDQVELAKVVIERLVQQGKRAHLPDLERAIDRVWMERYGLANVRITSAHPLSKETEKDIESVIAGADLRVVVDTALIGGAIIEKDDQVLDGSIRGRLQQLHSHFVKD
ncbi:F0F1 ATP synthase subunit delta [Candidatus Uhrbacteria bacterium]|nr:F0F1 ATP synthase subunit delta [Candidatus Uhrbacteria bacterium]